MGAAATRGPSSWPTAAPTALAAGGAARVQKPGTMPKSAGTALFCTRRCAAQTSTPAAAAPGAHVPAPVRHALWQHQGQLVPVLAAARGSSYQSAGCLCAARSTCRACSREPRALSHATCRGPTPATRPSLCTWGARQAYLPDLAAMLV